uniref:3'-5' exonuclease domain-containing protein n=1 Tax=Macrostomum lignano TaxID=282301 RepID=A0A1I8G8B8_9PLAT
KVADQSAPCATIIDSDASFAKHWPEFESRARQLGYCGLDCEWRWQNEFGEVGQLALLQLATDDGRALLIRVQRLTVVPPQLEAFLADRTAIDLGCDLSGWVDLRHLADRLPPDLVCHRRGLKPLANHMLSVDYFKLQWVARTDWELPCLTKQQVLYSALDAITGAMLAVEMSILIGESVENLCTQFIDVKHTTGPAGQQQRQTDFPGPTATQLNKKLPKFARQNPLYHNCQMLAPDDELMCTLDKRKADWYTERGLATVVSTDPILIIRLNFEPSGRPRGDQAYYLAERDNRCVVCGSVQGLQRKKIVPEEFRRHFPELLKSHKSHDILLLCGRCHAISERHTEAFKKELIHEFGLETASHTVAADQRAKSLAKALLAHASGKANIPEARLTEISSELKQIIATDLTTDAEDSDDEDEDSINSIPIKKLQAIVASAAKTPAQQSSQLARIVVQKCLDSGRLLELERRWRDHFLTSMKPKYLPEGWSVEHQHELLRPKLEQLVCKDLFKK